MDYVANNLGGGVESPSERICVLKIKFGREVEMPGEVLGSTQKFHDAILVGGIGDRDQLVESLGGTGFSRNYTLHCDRRQKVANVGVSL